MSDSLVARLSSPDGRVIMAELGHDALTSSATLRLGERLRRRFPAELVAAAFTLHDLRTRARDKFRLADEMWLTRPGLEQATSEPISRYRAQRFVGSRQLADLCTGIGGDLISLAGVAPVIAADIDPDHLEMALSNAAVYGHAEAVFGRLADVREIDLAGIDAVFIDPARRADDRRLGPMATRPPMDWCFELTDRVDAVGIKAAPGIDHAIIPIGWELETIAVGRDLKEAVLWSPALARGEWRATVFAASDPGDLTPPATLTAVGGDPVPVAAPGDWLFDPNPAVTRAGLVEDLARMIGGWKIDEQIAFLSANTPTRTPFARALPVLDSLPWREKAIAVRLRELDIGRVDIRRRGLAGDVEQIQKRLRLRGTRPAMLAMTRVNDQPWCIICGIGEEAPDGGVA